MYEDKFEEDPKAMMDAMRGEDGEIVIEETGDELFDKWEREFQQGLVPDLTEGLSQEELAKLEKEKQKAKKVRSQQKELAAPVVMDPRYEDLLLGSGTSFGDIPPNRNIISNQVYSNPRRR